MLLHSVPLDGGTVGSRPGGEPVGLTVLAGTPPRAASTRSHSNIRPGRDVRSGGEARSGAAVRPVRRTVPCQEAEDADLWFADTPADLERAKSLCSGCPLKAECLAGALRREEPWGVWGGEIFQRGRVIARKRPRGRPSKAALARDRSLAEAGAPL